MVFYIQDGLAKIFDCDFSFEDFGNYYICEGVLFSDLEILQLKNIDLTTVELSKYDIVQLTEFDSLKYAGEYFTQKGILYDYVRTYSHPTIETYGFSDKKAGLAEVRLFCEDMYDTKIIRF